MANSTAAALDGGGMRKGEAMARKSVGKIEVIARGVATAGRRVLLCVNEAGGYAYLPGGHVEAGESAAAALERELMEEAGARARVGGLLLAHEHHFKQEGERRHEINLVFHVEHLLTELSVAGEAASPALDDSPPTIASREKGVAFCWAAPEELERVNLQPASIRDWLTATARAIAASAGGAGGALPTIWRSDAPD